MNEPTTRLKPGDTIRVEGRRWKQCNGYFTAAVYVNDEHVATLPFRPYGVDNQYKYEAFTELRRMGLLPEQQTGDWWKPPRQVAETLGIKLTATATDVRHREELHLKGWPV